MCLPSQSRKPTSVVDSSDVGPYGFEGCESTALSFNFADDVFSKSLFHVVSCSAEPSSLLLQKIGRDALSLRCEVLLMASRLVQSSNCLVDLVPLYARTSFQPVGSREL